MASSLLLLLDDIATVLDDVAVMSKMAAKKTAGVLGDDCGIEMACGGAVPPLLAPSVAAFAWWRCLLGNCC